MRPRYLFAATRHGRWLPFYRESTDPIHAAAMRYRTAITRFEVAAWTLTIVFAMADVATTALGLPHPLLAEAVPITRWVVQAFGWPGLVVEQLLALGLLGAMWHGLPRPYRLIVPVEGACAGYLVTHNNLVALATHDVVLVV